MLAVHNARILLIRELPVRLVGMTVSAIVADEDGQAVFRDPISGRPLVVTPDGYIWKGDT